MSCPAPARPRGLPAVSHLMHRQLDQVFRADRRLQPTPEATMRNAVLAMVQRGPKCPSGPAHNSIRRPSRPSRPAASRRSRGPAAGHHLVPVVIGLRGRDLRLAKRVIDHGDCRTPAGMAWTTISSALRSGPRGRAGRGGDRHRPGGRVEAMAGRCCAGTCHPSGRCPERPEQRRRAQGAPCAPYVDDLPHRARAAGKDPALGHVVVGDAAVVDRVDLAAVFFTLQVPQRPKVQRGDVQPRLFRHRQHRVARASPSRPRR